MAYRMRALRSWFNRQYEGKVRRGDEFEAASEARAKELERRGLAERAEPVKKPGAVVDGDGSRPTSGPTGATASSSSSEAGQAPETPARRSRRSQANQEQE